MNGGGTQELQRLFARVIAEPVLLDQLAQPEHFAETHGYPLETVTALALVARRGLAVVAHDTAQKRRKRLQDIVPMTIAVLNESDRADRLLSTYFTLNPPRHIPDRAGTLLDAAAFAASLRAQTDAQHRGFGEFAAYEVMLREADAAASLPDPVATCRPRLASGVLAGSFTCRVDLAYERVANGTVGLVPFEPLDSHFVVRSRGKGVVDIHHVHESVVSVLRHCRGNRDVHEISEQCPMAFPRVAQVLMWAKNRQLVCWEGYQ